MKIRNCIYGCAALAILSVLSGCADSENVIEDVASVDDPGIIHIGGIANTELETSLGSYATRADDDKTPVVDAETVDWLLSPLFGGLDITYGKVAKEAADRNERVAILKLLKKNEQGGEGRDNIKYSIYSTGTEKIAEYSFKYRTSTGGEGEDAKWYGNGAHYFQGVFVPDHLRYKPASSENVGNVNDATLGKAKNLKIDQSKDGVNDNYTLLERYLGMPADATINATVGRVKLPFRHRLARVIAYVLIDPTMGDDVTIEGYKKDPSIKDKDGNVIDDAATTEIKFCKVKVLAGVEENDDTSGHATLTPQWDEARKAIPHFVGEKGCQNSIGEDYAGYTDNFIMFYDTEKKVYIFPANDKDWEDAKDAWETEYTKALGTGTSDADKRKAAEKADEESGYKRTVYGKVPVYDLIVRPTYKTAEKVMYDEDLGNSNAEAFAELENSIDFELTLSTGLQYTKHFEFDLDANYQTIVYLRINRKSIDYNSSGADKWDEGKVNEDGYYGVNNQNGNTLSFAGSSWQRAYRIGSTNPAVTDGHYYGQDDTTDDDNVQDDDVMPWYPQYVDTDEKWIKMFAEAHEGGLHHGDYFILDKNITIDAAKLPADFVFTGHLDGQDHTITLTGMGQKVVDEEAWDEDYYLLATSEDYSSTLYLKNDDVYTPYVMPTLYVYHEAVEATYYETVEDYNEGHKNDPGFTSIDETTFLYLTNDEKIKTQAQDAWYEEASPQPSVAELMSGTYYELIGDEYIVHRPELYANHPIHHDEKSHTSGTTLFAGLNGAYAASISEANVHSEGGILVPYVDSSTGTGWRAEVINTIVKDADMFPADVIKTDGTYDVNKVSGYIYNCWKVANPKNEKIKSHTPTLPKYK